MKKFLLKTDNKPLVDIDIHDQISSLRWISIAVIGLFVVAFCGALLQLTFQSTVNTDQMIVADVQMLQKVFTQIHQDCTIVEFGQGRNEIDFLTVEKFIGTDIGGMTLLYPGLWQGPYLGYNLMMQHEPYVIVKTLSGYYIVPGNGVTLSNGQVLGRDIIIDKKTNMENLLSASGGLLSTSGQLAAKIPVGATFLQKIFAPTEVFRLYDTQA